MADHRPVLFVRIDRALLDALDRMLETERARTGYAKLRRNELVVRLLSRAIDQPEAPP